MLQTITLKCSNCSGNLEISNEIDLFACAYCGVSQIVERKGGIISLKIITDAVSKIQIGTDKTASELAIQRLKNELDDVVNKSNKLQTNRKRVFVQNLQIFLGLAIMLILAVVFVYFKYDSYLVVSVIIGLCLTILSTILFIYINKKDEVQYKKIIDKYIERRNNLEQKLSFHQKIVGE